MIEFRSVRKTYHDNNNIAIKDASFKIERGEFAFLVGPSGAGKSTILKMIYKAELPTDGNVMIFQRDTRNIKTKILRRHVGVVFQDYQLLPNKTTYENVSYVLEALGKNPFKIKKITMEALDRMGIAHKAKHYPSQMSGGEQQRIAIARAIVNNPEILVCDEPTGNLDPETSWEIMNYIEELNKNGSTIIMSTHNMGIVEQMQKRVIQVKDGIVRIEQPSWTKGG